MSTLTATQIAGALPGRPYRLAARNGHRPPLIHVGDVAFGGGGVVVIAGPCAVEGPRQVAATARAVHEAGAAMLRGGAYKPRTSPYAFRGLGAVGLQMLVDAGRSQRMPVVTEVLSELDVEVVAAHADMLQIGARNMANYALLEAAADTGKPILLKRGMAATVKEWLLAAEYLLARGNPNVVLCERGVRGIDSEYTRNTLDLGAVAVAKLETHLPVIVDPSHAAGRADIVRPLALAAIAAGADGLIVEVHPDPATAQCDGPQSLDFSAFQALMASVRAVAAACGRSIVSPPRVLVPA